MDFVSGALIGGLLYDMTKFSLINTVENIKTAFKDSILKELKDDDLILISKDLEKATPEDKSSKENLIDYFENRAEHSKNIINKYEAENIQINNGDNNKQINKVDTYIEKQIIEKSDSKEPLKKH